MLSTGTSCISSCSCCLVMCCSFVRSVSMDKWKDMELEKMKVGGNQKAREFFNSQPDYQKSMSLLEKYNTKAAALYRDKVISLPIFKILLLKYLGIL